MPIAPTVLTIPQFTNILDVAHDRTATSLPYLLESRLVILDDSLIFNTLDRLHSAFYEHVVGTGVDENTTIEHFSPEFFNPLNRPLVLSRFRIDVNDLETDEIYALADENRENYSFSRNRIGPLSEYHAIEVADYVLADLADFLSREFYLDVSIVCKMVVLGELEWDEDRVEFITPDN